MTRAQMKQAAKDQLRGNWGWAICLTIFAWLVNAVIMDLNRWIWTGKDFTYTVLRFNKETTYFKDISQPIIFQNLLSA